MLLILLLFAKDIYFLKFVGKYTHYFNEKLKLIKTNIYTPVTDRNNFMKKLEEYHGKNHNGIQKRQHILRKSFTHSTWTELSEIT